MNTTRITLRKACRVLLGALLVTTGISHLTVARKEFRAQVPDWVPASVDDTVVASGIAEVLLGASLIAAGNKEKEVGKIAALFFAAVFPGNISQYVHKRNAFGLNTDSKRFARLFFQPVLIFWALKSTNN